MIYRVGRSKAGALRPVAQQEPDPGSKSRVVAGPEPHDMALDQITADVIGKDDHNGNKSDPHPFILFEIHQNEYQQENI